MCQTIKQQQEDFPIFGCMRGGHISIRCGGVAFISEPAWWKDVAGLLPRTIEFLVVTRTCSMKCWILSFRSIAVDAYEPMGIQDFIVFQLINWRWNLGDVYQRPYGTVLPVRNSAPTEVPFDEDLSYGSFEEVRLCCEQRGIRTTTWRALCTFGTVCLHKNTNFGTARETNKHEQK